MGKEIEVKRKYYLQEVVDNKFIPSIETYGALYNLVTFLSNAKKKDERILNKNTEAGKLKAEHEGHPWGKISGKIFVEGAEIIKFLKLNNL